MAVVTSMRTIATRLVITVLVVVLPVGVVEAFAAVWFEFTEFCAAQR